MTDIEKDEQQQTEMPETEAKETPEDPENREENASANDEQITDTARFREASYVVLFIAAVFTINAMETGSYRTPWPVAIVTTLIGLGLFGYSLYLKSRSKT